MSYYSQNDEERFLLEYFSGKPPGRFLDIGAFDGVSLSNTRRLLELGWSGVLVEAAWRNFPDLCRNCVGFPVTLICAAVSATPGLKRLWVDDAPDRKWSTTINEGLLNVGSVIHPNPQDTRVSAITMSELWPLGPYDFVSIDAEWEDFDILRSQSREQWRQAPLICAEPRGAEERVRMKDYFDLMGFAVVYETPENLIVERR